MVEFDNQIPPFEFTTSGIFDKLNNIKGSLVALDANMAQAQTAYADAFKKVFADVQNTVKIYSSKEDLNQDNLTFDNDSYANSIIGTS
ncbi:UNVERIFIED_CONTAM: hypothetical protein O8I53_07785 [Campylobacter lari]